MLALDFHGSKRLIEAVDASVALGDCEAVTAGLRRSLCELIGDPALTLPDCVMECCGDHYARRELYRSEKYGYSIVAMTWGPGQGTPIHDHQGLWCVEGVFHGQLEICQYELVESEGNRYHFVPAGTINAGPGSAGSLIPPHEYHTIRNPSDQRLAVSLHIYKAPITNCSVFEHEGAHWYTRGERVLPQDLQPLATH